METPDTTNLQTDFVAFMDKLIHDTTSLYFRSKKAYPVTESVLCANAYYARILFDVVFNLTPSSEQLMQANLEEMDADTLLSSALYLYRTWQEKGTERACEEYCDFLNGLIDEQAFIKTTDEWVLLPDFHSKKSEILDKLYEMKSI